MGIQEYSAQMGIRFAPSPTGKFHLGNLRTAWVSWMISQREGRVWICRFEDIDRSRVLPGALDQQLADLKKLGMVPDQVLIQSESHQRHLQLFLQAVQSGQVYPCFCSRKEILEALQTAASAPHHAPPIYNGRCRDGLVSSEQLHPTVGWRFRGEDPGGVQDFIIGRTEALDLSSFQSAYQWACAIDDYDGNFALLVRAWDLSGVLTQQRAIHAWLGRLEGHHPIPAIFHASLVVGRMGERLEKRTRGVTLDEVLLQGVSIQKILDGFDLSFQDVPDFSPGAVSGEQKHELSWDHLFSSPVS